MENIIKKLEQSKNDENPWEHWNLEERQQLLYIYYIISKKESHIFNLIYTYQGCDDWEDIFRDYDVKYLKEKANGVEVAITEINEIIEQEKNTEKHK